MGLNRNNVFESMYGYPITETIYVAAVDVDNVLYKTENIDISVKEFRYYNESGAFVKKDIFTYAVAGTKPLNVKNSYTSTSSLFKGIWSSNSTPSDIIIGTFYYIFGTRTVNSISFVEKDLLILSNDTFGNPTWKKGKMDEKGNCVAI